MNFFVIMLEKKNRELAYSLKRLTI